MQSFALEKMERRITELEAERDRLLAENAELRALREKIRELLPSPRDERDWSWDEDWSWDD